VGKVRRLPLGVARNRRTLSRRCPQKRCPANLSGGATPHNGISTRDDARVRHAPHAACRAAEAGRSPRARRAPVTHRRRARPRRRRRARQPAPPGARPAAPHSGTLLPGKVRVVSWPAWCVALQISRLQIGRPQERGHWTRGLGKQPSRSTHRSEFPYCHAQSTQ
jgi:hypothetical protein